MPMDFDINFQKIGVVTNDIFELFIPFREDRTLLKVMQLIWLCNCAYQVYTSDI